MSYLTDNIERLEEASITWNTVVQRMDVLFHEELFHSNGTASDPTMVIVRLLQELADRRKADAEHDALLDSLKDETDVYVAQEKCSTYDERDMQKANIYIHDNGQQVKQEVNWWDAKAEKDLVERQAKADIARMNADAESYGGQHHLETDHFYKLRGQMVELGLLSEDASDSVAFIAIRDILAAHAQDKSYDARYGATTATNASKEQGRAFLEPSSQA